VRKLSCKKVQIKCKYVLVGIENVDIVIYVHIRNGGEYPDLRTVVLYKFKLNHNIY